MYATKVSLSMAIPALGSYVTSDQLTVNIASFFAVRPEFIDTTQVTVYSTSFSRSILLAESSTIKGSLMSKYLEYTGLPLAIIFLLPTESTVS